jgi:hypothetical protein
MLHPAHPPLLVLLRFTALLRILKSLQQFVTPQQDIDGDGDEDGEGVLKLAQQQVTPCPGQPG